MVADRIAVSIRLSIQQKKISSFDSFTNRIFFPFRSICSVCFTFMLCARNSRKRGVVDMYYSSFERIHVLWLATLTYPRRILNSVLTAAVQFISPGAKKSSIRIFHPKKVQQQILLNNPCFYSIAGYPLEFDV